MEEGEHESHPIEDMSNDPSNHDNGGHDNGPQAGSSVASTYFDQKIIIPKSDNVRK